MDKLSPFDADEQQYFGSSVSIHNNYLVIGSSRDNIGPTDQGSAYIYHYNNDLKIWNFTQKIFASDASANDRFGYSTSIYGNNIIIGTYDDKIFIN